MPTINENALDFCTETWNRAILSGETLYKPMTKEGFAEFFLSERDYAKYFEVESENGEPVGWASGCRGEGANTGYVTFIYVLPELRRRGIGSALLRKIEEDIRRDAVNTLERIDVMFLNPMQLPWFIPSHSPHDHPCAPGADMYSTSLLLLKNSGYRVYSIENSYYMPLANYRLPEKIIRLESSLFERGIAVTRYDENSHSGLNELFTAIKNEGWRAFVMAHLERPVIVAIKDGRVIGYTGPLSVDPSGRGSFCGIGVDPEYRGNGAGSVLFAHLCDGLRNIGASFMSLYTGETNPARNIYEAAGFKVVRSWASMRKAVK